MNEDEIKQAIEYRVNKIYSLWTIGVTDDPERRKEEHDRESKNTKFWRHWEADTEAIARSVESCFKAKGMKGGTGGPGSPNFVYIF